MMAIATARPRVTKRVIVWIFFCPSLPSFAIRSSAGIAIVNSCIMIEALIYGVIERPKMEASWRAPPVRTFR